MLLERNLIFKLKNFGFFLVDDCNELPKSKRKEQQVFPYICVQYMTQIVTTCLGFNRSDRGKNIFFSLFTCAFRQGNSISGRKNGKVFGVWPVFSSKFDPSPCGVLFGPGAARWSHGCGQKKQKKHANKLQATTRR